MKCFPKNDLVKFWNLVVGTSRVAHPIKYGIEYNSRSPIN